MSTTKPKTALANAKLSKRTYNSLVYASLLGPSLYFNREVFKGEEPEEITISLEWQPSPDESLR